MNAVTKLSFNLLTFCVFNFFVLTIACTQNVGIDIINPEAKLHINSSGDQVPLILEDSGISSQNGLQFRRSGSTDFFEFKRILGGSPTSSYLDFNHNTTEVMTIRGDGNVGVNNLNPTNRLDVIGDVNLTGNIKIDNSDGSPGQVLAVQADGSTGWGNANSDRFEHFYTFSSDGNWTIPPDVTEICIEAWGGGAGGSIEGGGGSGAYVKAVFNVSSGLIVAIDIGPGGAASTNGTNTRVTYNGSFVFTASGGSSSSIGGGKGGFIGFGNGASSIQSIYGLSGADGEPTRIEYQQKNATTFVKAFYYGDGGEAPFRPGSEGLGGTRIANENSSGSGSFDVTNGTYGNYGGGGAAGPTGFLGGSGVVVIRW